MNNSSHISRFDTARKVGVIRPLTDYNEANLRARLMSDRSGIDQIVDSLFVTESGHRYNKPLIIANSPETAQSAAAFDIDLRRRIDSGMNDAHIPSVDMMPLDEVILH